jgi:hypothetical protein
MNRLPGEIYDYRGAWKSWRADCCSCDSGHVALPGSPAARAFVASLDAAHEQFVAGILSMEHLVHMRGFTEFVLKAPGGVAWWEQYGSRFSPPFRAYVDKHVYGST